LGIILYFIAKAETEEKKQLRLHLAVTHPVGGFQPRQRLRKYFPIYNRRQGFQPLSGFVII